MKATGVVRRIDELGRIVIPKEIREVLDIDIRDSMEIFVDNDLIIFRKYMPACIFCGEAENIIDFCGKKICQNCIVKIQKSNE